jgi:hypothetical protein
MNVRCFNPQFFIASRVGDTALEQEDARWSILDHRLGVVIDALKALGAAVPADALLPGDRLALDRLEELERVDSPAARDGAGDDSITAAEVDSLIRRLRRLRRDDPETADDVLRRLVEETAPLPAPDVTA